MNEATKTLLSTRRCDHPRCQEATHCILDALWINASEFENPEPIQAASALQDSFWKLRREFLEREAAVVETLWFLVEQGGANV